MNIVSISDTHIEREGDAREKVLDQFFNNKVVCNSDIIVLNGDIFDYVTGYHPSYYDRFKRFFNHFKKCLEKNQKIVFIEGNHDVHIQKTFDRFIQENNLNKNNFIYQTHEFKVIDSGARLLFSHGDEIDGSSPDYLKYKKIIRSPLLRIVAHILPLPLFDFLAKKASTNSREKSNKYSSDETRMFFRKGASSYQDVDILILGHSHIEDEFKDGKKKYFNNGFPLQTKKFFFWNGEKASLVSIN